VILGGENLGDSADFELQPQFIDTTHRTPRMPRTPRTHGLQQLGFLLASSAAGDQLKQWRCHITWAGTSLDRCDLK